LPSSGRDGDSMVYNCMRKWFYTPGLYMVKKMLARYCVALSVFFCYQLLLIKGNHYMYRIWLQWRTLSHIKSFWQPPPFQHQQNQFCVPGFPRRWSPLTTARNFAGP
jgi:hypothetical protein